jgi:outer membrane protein insertion porin family
VERGYALARASLQVRYQADSATVVIDVEKGEPVRVDSIRIEGLRRSRRELVRRELTLQRGDLLTGRRILDSQERILGTGVFQRARIVPEFPDSTRPLAVLAVVVDERRTSWLGAGAGYTSADRLRFVGEWGVRNLTGMGRRLGLTANLYYSLSPDFRGGGLRFRESLLQADYVEPWLFRSRTRGLLSPYVRWLQEESFHQRTIGYAVTFRRDLRQTRYLSVGFQSKHVATTQEGVVPRYTTRFVNLEYVDDKRDDPFDPSRGRYAQGAVEYAGGLLGGTNEFGRVTATLQGYTRLPEGWVVAGRIRGGWIQPFGRGPLAGASPDTSRISRVPWEERFRLGGGNTVRGYPEGRLGRLNPEGEAVGGLALLLASIELRFPLVSIVQGALFLDGGNVWADPAEFGPDRLSGGLRDRGYDPLNMAYAMGGGLRLRTPVGPFRFDYGVKLGSGRAPGESAGELHVALGQAF